MIDATEAKRRTEDTETLMYNSLVKWTFKNIEYAISTGEYNTRVNLNPTYDMPAEVVEEMNYYNYLTLGLEKISELMELLSSKGYKVEYEKACAIAMSPPLLFISWE